MESFCSDQIRELAQALIKVQEQLQPATKDANNPFTKSKYATLNSIMDSCAFQRHLALPVSGSHRAGISWLGHEAHPCGVGTMAVESCRGSPTQG